MKTTEYKNHLITYKVGYYWALGQAHASLKKAKTKIDALEN